MEMHLSSLLHHLLTYAGARVSSENKLKFSSFDTGGFDFFYNIVYTRSLLCSQSK